MNGAWGRAMRSARRGSRLLSSDGEGSSAAHRCRGLAGSLAAAVRDPARGCRRADPPARRRGCGFRHRRPARADGRCGRRGEGGPDARVHAAYAKDRESIVDATRHVVDAANAVGAHVLFISTDAVFLGDGLARDEQSTPDATWDYGRSKATAERIVLDYSEHSAIVRLPLLVSIDPDDHVVREIRAAAVNGMRTRWFTDEMRRPTFASDAAAAIWRIAALSAGERRGCWHLAGAERLSRLEIARRMVDRLHLPGGVIESAAQPDNCDRPRDIAFTDARARATVGWRPSPIA